MEPKGRSGRWKSDSAGRSDNTNNWDNNYGRTPLGFYVPDEICLVTTSDGREPLDTRHDRLREEHNDFLAQHTQNALPIIGRLNISGALEKDLTPAPETLAFLQAKVESGAHILRDLNQANGQRPRWIRLPDARGEKTATTSTLLHCFAIGDEDDRERPPAERARVVRDLVLLSNLHFRHIGAPVRAVPNWFAVACEDRCPSPGSAPVWWESPQARSSGAGYWSFAFSGERAKEAVRHGRETPSSVIIAVLDTSPTAEAVEEAAKDPRHQDNILLRHVAAASNVTIDRRLPGPPLSLEPLNGTANWRDRGQSGDTSPPEVTLRMDDHGLFITGIIHDIAPNAEINLIRVLNGYGVTNHHAMIHALTRLPYLLDNDKQRLIVNLSMGLAIPPGVEMIRLWMHETYEMLGGNGNRDLTPETALAALQGDDRATLKGILDDLHAALKDIIDWLTTHPQVLVVAAAGNDNRFFGQRALRPEPRWPARYDGVLSVAAVGLSGQPAEYSNRGDVIMRDGPTVRNGVATFGGDADRVNDGDLGVIDPGASPVDAVLGIYASEELTLGTGENETGWAYWSGTSFATPVIAALAADIWDMHLAEHRQNPCMSAYSPPELIAEIVADYFTPPHNATAPGILSTPTY